MEFLFEIRLGLSKRFPPGTATLGLGKYELRPIPSSSSDGEAILSFVNTFEAPVGGGSHPDEEAAIVARCLSLCMDARLRRSGIRVNHIDIPISPQGGYPQFEGICDSSDLAHYLEIFRSLPDDLCRQFSRAASTYSFALEFIPGDPTFAFFLLVVAIECLSSQDAVIPHSQINPENGTCERFCAFVK